MMKTLLLLLCCLLVITAFAQNGPDSGKKTSFKLPQGVTEKDYLPGVVIVKFKKGSTSGQINSVSSSFISRQVAGKTADAGQISRVFKNSIKAQTAEPIQRRVIEDTIGLDRVYHLKFDPATGVEKVINELLKNPLIEYAEPSYVYYASYIPNDPFYSGNQAYLRQVKAEQSWDLIRNSSNTIIAIVDTGTDMDHADLKANILSPGIDLVGADFANSIEDNDPDVKSDSAGHGVMVSGIASAISNNGFGIASLASDAKLMIVKVSADNRARTIYRGYEGIKYAADNGAHIINCSWGGPAGGFFGQDIINYAFSKGCMVIAAAGNSSSSQIDYPAAFQGVIAVASVDINDKKSSFSNYGNSVTLSAPGEIFTTSNGNKFTNTQGTSFSTPLVSSAAALVRSKFPQYDMFQIGEQLRVTADNIDSDNPAYAGQMGTGRLNVFRALTENLPSIRYQNITLVDKGKGAIPVGDTLKIFLDIENFLSPVSGLTIKLSTANPNIQVINEQLILESIGTKELKTIGPFQVFIKPGVTDNEPVDFKLTYTSGTTYSSSEQFQVLVARDFLNVEVNQVSSTITSNGRIGYRDFLAQNGLGFMYKSEPMLFEASLMIGNSPTAVSNNVRSQSGESDEHFIKHVRVFNDTDPASAFLARSEFDDSGNPGRLGLNIKHNVRAFSAAPDDKYIIAEYEIQNTGLNTLNGVYAGLFTDWDLDLNGSDVTKYDAVNRLAYAFGKFGKTPYAGVKLLSKSIQAVYYPMTYLVNGDPLESDNEFTLAEKYQALSSGIKAMGLGDNAANGYDISFVSGYGPFNLPVNGNAKVAFALIGGDSLSDLQASAVAAQTKYDELNKTPVIGTSDSFVLRQNFPNPVADKTEIDFSLARPGLVKLVLFNVTGQAVRELFRGNLAEGYFSVRADLSGLDPGVYLYKMMFEGEEKTLKLLISR
ncbi:S8 family serine peptidase [Daejeonella sp. H1SJ63]|uniref:S8 family serine peptidase n=1 Tax=Daejeonella sp. H1SJ63 TaxID=3034145 RepID=UPI0023ED8909|nr:S8 family serine peptidase [Daejeonella sp. H1SJ63]